MNPDKPMNSISGQDPSRENPGPAMPPPIPQVPVTFAGLIDDLLKRPVAVLTSLQAGNPAAKLKRLLLVVAGCFVVFGLILAMFSGGAQYAWAPLKLVAGIAICGLITLPSLYVFSCLNGHDVTLKSVAGVLVACLALVGLLLIGLAPVLWVFTQSTGSLPFLGGLALACWAIALAFGLSLIFKTSPVAAAGTSGYLNLWIIIFVLVTLQMTTSLRPLIGTAETILPVEKKFFLVHWFDEISRSAREAASESTEGSEEDRP